MKIKNWNTLFFKSTGHDFGKVLVRLIVGLIFLTEGIQKHLFPDEVGTGRFMEIGFSDPSFWAYFTANFEIVCGLFVLIGFLTRWASIPLFVIMLVAFITTKWPIMMEKGFWPFAHAYRTDFALTLLLVYLILYGAGKISVDAVLFRKPREV